MNYKQYQQCLIESVHKTSVVGAKSLSTQTLIFFLKANDVRLKCFLDKLSAKTGMITCHNHLRKLVKVLVKVEVIVDCWVLHCASEPSTERVKIS